MRRFLPDIALLLLLFLIPLAFFWPVTLGGQTLIPADNLYQFEPWASYREAADAPATPHNALLSDLVLQNFQWKTFIRQSISNRDIPLWQPNQFAGTPFMANGQHSILYPFSLIYYVLPLESAFGWFTVSQLWLAGALMYLFIRGIGLGRIAGLVAALSYQLSSFYIVATVHPMIQAGAAWLPLLLLMLEYTIQRRPFPLTRGRPTRLPWVLIGGVALSMPHLAGHIEITYYSLLIMALYTALRLGILAYQQPQDLKTHLASGLFALGMVILGFGIGAAQFIPNLEAANNSFRADREDSYEMVLSYALPKRHLVKWFLPNAFGNPAHHRYWDVFTGEWVDIHDAWQAAHPDASTSPNSTDFGIKNYVEGGAYIGLLPLALAAYALISAFWTWRNKSAPHAPPYRLIFLILAVLSLSLMFGTPIYALLYHGLPGINQLHTPFRWIWPLTLCIAVLAAFGVQTLQASSQSATPKTDFFAQLAQKTAWFLISTGLLLILALIATRLFFDQFEPLISAIYERLGGSQGGAKNAFVSVKAFYSYEFRNVLIAALILLGAGASFRMSRSPLNLGKNTWRFPAWQGLAVVLIVFDLFATTYDFNTVADKKWLDYTPPAIEWLTEQQHSQDPFRIQAYNWGEEPLIANAGWRYGLQDLRGYDSLFSQDYAEMMGQIVPQGQLDFNRIASIYYSDPQALANPLLDLLNVRYIITDWLILPDGDPADLGYEEVYIDAGVRIYENLDVLPRAYTAPLPADGKSYQLGEACTETPTAADPAQLAFIPPLGAACIEITPATITQQSSSEIYVDASVEAASWLVLADNYDAGWRVFIRERGAEDDQEQEIDLERVNLNLRGVKLEAGDWTIRFRYSPASFQIGMFTSFISVMVMVFLALLWLWRTFVSASVDENSDKRLLKNSLAPILLNLFNRGIDFAFAFIMLRILGPSNAGIYYYAIVIFGWFDIFTNFGLNTLLTREVSRNREAAGRYLFNTSILRLAFAGLGIPVLALVLYIRTSTVSPALDTTAIISIVLLYIGLLPNSISTGLTALFYAFEKAEYPAALTTLSTLVKVTLGLGALLMGWGVVGLAASSIATNLVTFIALTRLAWPLIRDHWQPIRDGSLQRSMVREAWPLMINHLLATVFFKSDIILMEAINGVNVVGVYSTAYKWLDALNVIPAFFTMALLPIISRHAHENRAAVRRHYLLGIKLLTMVSLPTAVMTTFMATGLIGFLGGREFLPDGATSLQLMIWSIPIGWMNSLTQYVLIAIDRQRQITWAFIVAVSFNIIANLLLLPRYSFYAAALTTIASEFLLFIGFLWLLRDLLHQVNWLQLLWRLATATTVTLLITGVLWGYAPIVALLIGTLVYIGVLGWLNPFDAEETARLQGLLPQRLRRFFKSQASQQNISV